MRERIEEIKGWVVLNLPVSGGSQSCRANVKVDRSEVVIRFRDPSFAGTLVQDLCQEEPLGPYFFGLANERRENVEGS